MSVDQKLDARGRKVSFRAAGSVQPAISLQGEASRGSQRNLRPSGLREELNWQDLEASILSGGTENGTALQPDDNRPHKRDNFDSPVLSRSSRARSKSRSSPTSVGVPPYRLTSDGNSHSRNNSGGPPEEDYDDFEAGLRDAATRLVRSRWEELFQTHQQEREKQERERRGNHREEEMTQLRTRTMSVNSALQVFQKPISEPSRSAVSHHPLPENAIIQRAGSVAEMRARLLQQGGPGLPGPLPPLCIPSPQSADSCFAGTITRTRGRSGSFQDDRGSGRKRPQSVQLGLSAGSLVLEGIYESVPGMAPNRIAQSEGSKPKEKEMKRLMKEEAKRKAQQEKEERKESKRKKKEEKKREKENKKKQGKDREKRGSSNLPIQGQSASNSQPQRLNLTLFVSDRSKTSESPPSRQNSGSFGSARSEAEPELSTSGAGLSVPISQPSSSPLITPKTRALKTRVVKIEELDPKVRLFEEPDRADTITLGGKDSENVPLITAASIYKIIQRITFDQYPDSNFVTTFLLTYRSFIAPLELLELLALRFDTPAPANVDEEAFIATAQVHIRLRVFNVLKQWLMHHFYDFRDDPTLLDRLNRFIDDVMLPEAMVSAGEQLRAIIRQQLENESKCQELQFSTLPPAPILPVKRKSPFKLLDVHPLEVARQLTLIEHNLYRMIKPRECLKQRWTGKDKATLAPNIIALIDRFNKVSRWCCSEIVGEKDLKSRAVLLNRFIVIASQCRELNNFNGVMEILAGLQNSAAYRLKKTWNLLPNKTWDIWEDLTHLMSSDDNFRVFREVLHKINPPCIPYLGVFLTDLTFIEDGNPDFLSSSLINVTKLRYGARVMQDIKQYQQTPYCLEAVPFIRDWLCSRELYNEKDLYAHSLLCEERTPRKK